MEVEVTAKNTLDSSYEGNVTWEWFIDNSTSLGNKETSFVEISGNSAKNIRFKVTPNEMGEMHFRVSLEEFERIVHTSSTKVIPYGVIHTLTKLILVGAEIEENKFAEIAGRNMTFEIPNGCRFQKSTFIRFDVRDYIIPNIGIQFFVCSWPSLFLSQPSRYLFMSTYFLFHQYYCLKTKD